jgi:hypothetical protein
MLLLAISSQAATFKWTDPTAAELSMTSYPKAPGAPAIVLSYDEVDDGSSAEVTVHIRIKVLTSGGFSAANIDLPERTFTSDPYDQEIYARTIHPDGTVIPFTAKPYETTDAFGRTSKVISLPSVTVGSILEYGYHFKGLNSIHIEEGATIYEHLSRGFAPRWVVQQPYFLCAAHFRLDAPDIDLNTVHWVAKLPPGAEIKQIKNHVELNVTDIDAMPDEEFMPPASSVRYGASFFYWDGTPDAYWLQTGNIIGNKWKDFYKTTKPISDAITQIISVSDTDEQKLHKLYDAVMALENTDFTRKRSRQEDKSEKLKETHKSEDIWQRRRGSSRELALLYIALANAAGYEAYPMWITSRTSGVFNKSVLTTAQLDDLIAVVMVKGHEVFLDPGTRACAFLHLAWWHASVGGVTLNGKQPKFQFTPAEPTVGSQTQRTADIKLNETGNANGTVTITWINNAGLSLRHRFLREDQRAAETAAENSLQSKVPAGIQLKLVSLKGLDTYNTPVVATFSITGQLGTPTGKRLLVPAEFFAARAHPVLAAQTRIYDIDLLETYVTQDTMRFTLPPSITVEALPESKSMELAKDAGYQVIPVATNGAVIIQRAIYLSRIFYRVQEYDTLHKFFGEVATRDQDTLVLRTSAQ